MEVGIEFRSFGVLALTRAILSQLFQKATLDAMKSSSKEDELCVAQYNTNQNVSKSLIAPTP